MTSPKGKQITSIAPRFYSMNLFLLSRSLQSMKCAFIFATALVITGCANFYVDPGLKDIPPERMVKVVNPKPVQLLFEFQTKGASNPAATEHLKKQVIELVANSRIFSEISAEPVANGAILNVVINNVPLTDDAAAKGFATGITFGLAGNTVTDGYICTMDFVSAMGAPRLSKTVRHAIHTTVGAEGAPPNAKKAESIDDAVNTMVRQIVAHGLNNLASDASFK